MTTNETLDDLMVDLEDIIGEKLVWSTFSKYDYPCVVLSYDAIYIVRNALKELWEHDRLGG